MSKLLIAAFIAFGFAAILIIPNKSPEEIAVEAATIQLCQRLLSEDVKRYPAEQRDTLCRCAAPMAVAHLGTRISTIKERMDQLTPEALPILKRELLSCFGKHAPQ
jgi:hypothetical protein